MDDHVRPGLGEGRERAKILQHRDAPAKAGMARKFSPARLFQADVVIGGHAVVAVDLVAIREQTAAEVETDEAGGAGDENAHVLSPCPSMING